MAQTNPSADHHAPSLLTVPLEIRNMIYDHLFPPRTRFTVSQQVEYVLQMRNQWFESDQRFPLQLLRTCSRIKREAERVILHNLRAAFIVIDAIDFSTISSLLLQLIEELQFNNLRRFWIRPHEYATHFPRLEKIIAGTYVDQLSTFLEHCHGMEWTMISDIDQFVQQNAQLVFENCDFSNKALRYPSGNINIEKAAELVTPIDLPENREQPQVVIRVKFVEPKTTEGDYCSGVIVDVDPSARQVACAFPMYFHRRQLGSWRDRSGWVSYPLGEEEKLNIAVLNGRRSGQRPRGTILAGLRRASDDLEKNFLPPVYNAFRFAKW